MIFKNADDLFDKLAVGLARLPGRAREIAAIYCFKITGSDGGEWTVDCRADPPTCARGDAGSAQCVIEIGGDDFMKMLANSNLGMQLYFTGKLRLSGDPTLAMKLGALFELAAQ